MCNACLSSLIFILILSSAGCKLPDSAHTHTPVVQDSLVTVSISVTGDIMCHSVQYNYARVATDSFNFNPVFSEIKRYLNKSDFIFGNLETVTAGERKGYSGYPFFNSPDAFISALKNAGFDLLTTANNHAIDRGEAGVRRTIEQLERNHLNYNGTFLNERDRDSIRIFHTKGIDIAFLAYTYGTNGNPIPKGKAYLINLIDTLKIKNDIKRAKLMGAEIVLVHFHFGEEYQRVPNGYQREIVKKTILAGADIIIGGHTHVLQPIEFFKTSDSEIDSGFVIYSMGNFISNQRWRFSDGGAILTFSLTKNVNRGSIYLNDLEYLPIWIFKGPTGSGNQYVIIPSEAAFYDSLFEFLTPEDKKLAAQSFFDTKEIITKYSKKPRLTEISEGIITETKHLPFN